MHNPTAKPKHFARWQHRAAPACPPAGAFTIWVYWYIWLLLKFCSDFTTRHMRPPRPALPSFRVEMALYRGL